MRMKKWWYRLIKKSPADMPMVKYWKYQDKQEATVRKSKDGSLIMKISGEEEDFPGFPRGYLLFGKLSMLKHEIKWRIFNDSWRKLEEGVAPEKIIEDLYSDIFPRIITFAERGGLNYDGLSMDGGIMYDMVPPERMVSPVREIYRAWTKVAPGEMSLKLRDIVTFILQEDDSYRFRVQWMATYFNPNRWWMKLCGKNIIDHFGKALAMVEHGEVIGDMKEKQRLLKRVLLAILKDENIKNKFLAFCKEVDWKKIELSKADKYHFRGKYFKVDLDLFDY